MPAPTTPPGGSPYGLLAGISGLAPLPAPRPLPADRPQRRARPLPVAAVLLAAGLLLGVALAATRRSAPEVTRQRTAIEAQIAARTKEAAGLQAARRRLRDQIVQARGAAATAGPRARRITASVAGLSAATGAAAVTGPGLIVRLGDPANADAQRIADRDLAQVANALWAAGAEAVAVNGARLTARSAIRSAGGAVLVNLRPVASPYRVEAIGSPDILAAGFANSPVAARLRSAVAVYGSTLSVQVGETLRLPAATGLAATVARTSRETP